MAAESESPPPSSAESRGLGAVIGELSELMHARYPFVYIVTHEEERALDALATASRIAGRSFAAWTQTSGLFRADGPIDEADTRGPLSAIAAARGSAVGVTALRDFTPFLADPLVVRALRDQAPALEERGATIAFVAPRLVLPAELEKDVAVIDLPLPGPQELEEAVRRAATDAGRIAHDSAIASLARAARGLTLREARRVFRRVLAGHATVDDDAVRAVGAEKERLVRRSEVLEFVSTEEGLAGVGGLDALKRWLASRALAFGDAARRFGLPQPKGLFLLGMQGCGKSLTAKAVAAYWGLPLIRLDLGAVFGTGQSAEENLRAAMKLSESMSPVVLWVDEIEKGFAGVSGGGGGDAAAARAFGSFITWLQEKKSAVFVVATANDVTRLPPELLRKGRFDEIFFLDAPDVRERRAILEIHLRKRGRDPAQYDLEELARPLEHYVGAELEQIVVGGLYTAFGRGSELTMEDLTAEASATVPLYATYEEQAKEMREWARTRARRASTDATMLELFTAGGRDDGPPRARGGR